jgi:hypothetical protein
MAEIGDGSTINKMSPTETDNSGVLANQRVIKVSAGFDHTLALTGIAMHLWIRFNDTNRRWSHLLVGQQPTGPVRRWH